MTQLTLLETDWTPLESDATMPMGSRGDVDRLIETALNRFLWEWPWLRPQREDLIQDARIMVATRPSLRAAIRDPGRFVHELRCDLIDSVKGRTTTDHLRVSTLTDLASVSSDSGTSACGESHASDKTVYDSYVQSDQMFSDSTYSAHEVRVLLSSVFDPAYGLGYTRGSPEGTVKGFHPPALVADVRKAWCSALLTRRQRQALFMTVVVGCTQREAGEMFGVSREAISDREERGMTRLLRFLNGIEHEARVAVEPIAA